MPFDVCYRLGLQFENISSKVVTPRHIPLPTLPNDSSLMFEVIMFSFTAMTTFLQFLHLYRSVWWLPQSYTRHSMVRSFKLKYFTLSKIRLKVFQYSLSNTHLAKGGVVLTYRFVVCIYSLTTFLKFMTQAFPAVKKIDEIYFFHNLYTIILKHLHVPIYL